jgi:hypothetical protein
MSTFKEIAFQILQERGNPLHSKEITAIALERGWLKTAGKTPEATMNAQLIVDINAKKHNSRFTKIAPSVFGLNSTPADQNILLAEEAEKTYKISENISTKQKGDIAEARIAELITLYGETNLSCYKPISDDDGIDLIVKEKGNLKTMYLQVKSRYGSNPDEVFTATVKAANMVEHYSVGLIFCYFDTEKGDLWDYLWFIPAPALTKLAHKLNGGQSFGFVAGRQKRESNKWDDYLIDKRELANQILAQMKRTFS